jgi:hypothetical protein
MKYLNHIYRLIIENLAYFSHQLSKTERNYSTSERELLAIVLASHHFKQFLYGGKLIVGTDHQPLKYVLSTKEPAARLLRLLTQMNSFEYEIKYLIFCYYSFTTPSPYIFI